MEKVFGDFLEIQREEGLALAKASDVLDLQPLDPQRYLATFRCYGVFDYGEGPIVEADRFMVGIFMPDDYLRVPATEIICTFFGPRQTYHPNVGFPMICIGEVFPATTLVQVLHRLYEVVSYQNYGTDERDSLNPEACAWARANASRFPVDSRPLKRRKWDFEVDEIGWEAPL